MSNLEISAGTWVTAGGYIVKIQEYFSGSFMSSEETSPGTNIDGKTAKERRVGWFWNKDGTINLSPDWNEKLRIVKKFEGNLDDYEWDGYPMVDNIKKKVSPIITECGWYRTAGNYLIEIKKSITLGWISSVESSPGLTVDSFTAKQLDGWLFREDGTCHNHLQEDMSEKLRIVEKVEIEMPEGYEWDGYPRLEYPNGRPFLGKTIKGYEYRPHGADGKPFLDGFFLQSNDVRPIVKEKKYRVTMAVDTMQQYTENGGDPAMPIQESNKVNGKPSRLNYWVIEPATNLFRYALLITVIGGAGWGITHPSTVVKFIQSCLPKISIEAPEIINGRK